MRKVSKASSKKKATARGKKRKNKTDAILGCRDDYVVVDTDSNFLYIGKLADVGDHFVTLRDADVHDCRESPSMNEKYIIDAKKYGVRVNRRLVYVRLEEVVSISLLDHVIEY